MRALFLIGWLSLLGGCAQFGAKPPEAPPPPVPTQPPATPGTAPATPVAPPVLQPSSPKPPALAPSVEPPLPEPAVTLPPEDVGKTLPIAMPWLKPAVWAQLPGWRDDDLTLAWPAWLQSCQGLRSNPAFASVNN